MQESIKHTPGTKTERLNIRLSADEKYMLEQLAKEDNRSQSAEIGYLIKQAYQKLQPVRR